MPLSILFSGICNCKGLETEEPQACQWVNLASSKKETFASLFSIFGAMVGKSVPSNEMLLLTRGVQRLPSSMGAWLVLLGQLCLLIPHRL